MGLLSRVIGDGPAWRKHASAVITGLESQRDRLQVLTGAIQGNAEIADGVTQNLGLARNAANRTPTLQGAWFGYDFIEVWTNVHEARIGLLRMVQESPSELDWWGPRVLAEAEWHLGATDPRLAELKHHLYSHGMRLKRDCHGLGVAALRAAYDAWTAKRNKVRSFRNAILIASTVMALLAILWGAWGYADPQVGSIICFKDPVCPAGKTPSGIDVPLVELMGLTSAALVGTIALRNLGGTSGPFMVPIFLLLLKLPAGAISAVLGLVLVKGQIVPAIQPFHTSASVVAWAAVFGAAQELVTQLIDQKGREVLREAQPASRGFDQAHEEGR